MRSVCLRTVATECQSAAAMSAVDSPAPAFVSLMVMAPGPFC
jgi:hypothetical protein